MTTETKTLGRPTDLTPELQEKICSIIADGNYIETACNAVGIAQREARLSVWHVKEAVKKCEQYGKENQHIRTTE